MELLLSKYKHLLVLMLALQVSCLCHAQSTEPVAKSKAEMHREGYVADASSDEALQDSVDRQIDSMRVMVESVPLEVSPIDNSSVTLSVMPDSLLTVKKVFVPNPKKALWLAIVFPGGGQIYNRKYWKLPIIYGGFLGCMYAMNWNNTMYNDYSQAYVDIMDSDPNTKSYENFIPHSYDINSNLPRLQELFKRKKNYYRRYRDLSMFFMIGVYALSIVDAYVDAELSSFDISRDLSMKVHPTIINDRYSAMRASGMNGNSYGLQCSFNF